MFGFFGDALFSRSKIKSKLKLVELRAMGAFLDKPKTEKTNSCGEGAGLRYGVTSMQGKCLSRSKYASVLFCLLVILGSEVHYGSPPLPT